MTDDDGSCIADFIDADSAGVGIPAADGIAGQWHLLLDVPDERKKCEQEDALGQFIVKCLLRVVSTELGKLSQSSCLQALMTWATHVDRSKTLNSPHMLKALHHLHVVFANEAVVELESNAPLLDAVSYFVKPHAKLSVA